MDIKNVLSYLKEELRDIPANPDNIHYTSFQSLYHILGSGLKGQDYHIKTSKTKEGDMELATARNSHKLTDEEKESLSENANGGIRINLYTKRILAAHRNSRKAPIAELPQQRVEYIKGWENELKEKYGRHIPKLFDKNKPYFTNKSNRAADEKYIKSWLIDRGFINDSSDDDDRNFDYKEIYYYNRDLYHLSQELENREREERFILKKNIPVNKDFMEIVIEKSPDDFDMHEDEFIEDNTKEFLKRILEHDDVFLHNKKFREFKNYLLELIKKAD